MENTPTQPTHREAFFRLGIILLTTSFGIYLATNLITSAMFEDHMRLFMLHYAVVVFYFLLALFNGRYKKGRGGLPLVIITLLLFLISAYALNRQMDIFHTSVGWVQALLVVTSINLLLASLNIQLPYAIKVLQVFALTVGALFYTYLALYLIPIYAFGFIGAIAIGIGLHAFVPLLLLIYTITILIKTINAVPALKTVAFSAAGAVFLLIGLFTHRWSALQTNMKTAFHAATRADHTGWPAWVETLQNVPDGPLSGKILRSDIVYATPNFTEGFSFFGAPRIRWEESKKHDPLVAIASAILGAVSIPKEDRIRMLQTIHNNRYGAEERLWNGDNLETVHMNTEVQIWPAMHLAYAEKIITVAQKPSEQRWRGNQQEAIYIFQLPEGAVATSLSLWIDGKEEKSVLTTKGKATKAYTTIVGVEVRDPSVVHWQEGNRISVRIFPVMANDQRIFKIGITIPMPERDGKIWYEHFTFTGPSSKKAAEKVRVRLMQSPGKTIETVALKRQQENDYTYEGKYNPELSLAIPAMPLAKHAFVHEGKAFQLDAYKPAKAHQQFTTLYADVNAAWTNEDWIKLRGEAGSRSLYVHNQGWIQIDGLNEREMFERLKKRKITLFPFYDVEDVENSLVITKTAGRTPSMEDIRKSTGFDALVHAAAKGKRFNVYHIGEQPSLFISSLRELRLFHYAQGGINDLMADLNQNVFDADIESAQQVVIHNAGMVLAASQDVSVNNAPDHLLRLFAYNHIMQQGGLRLLADSSLEESRLGELAAYAHIVTPVSSMIVLEKREDYDRFDIDVNKEGLKNASAKNSGSVPEPHEWAIMMICLLLLAYYRFQRKINMLWLRK
ncbi:MAG: XrtN system VIT domain-containing protein [Bacteroidetes bacterium]|nr:MAG: XrtN system VIT domain-containing protein [Bacteroidota bacterium]